MNISTHPTATANFRHLVLDLAWFGLALAATTRFIQFYAIRLGATPMDVAMITSLPAFILIFSTSLSGWWRGRTKSIVRANVMPSLGFRLVFLLPVFAPLFPESMRPMWIILSAALPAIVQGMGSTLFIILMRSGVEPAQLPRLLSRRAFIMNVTISIGAIGFGFGLELFPFPLNYQLMFLMAFAFSLVSAWHVFQVKEYRPAPQVQQSQNRNSLREMLQRPGFQSVVFVTLMSHVAFFALYAVIPLHLENHLKASEGFIGVYGLAELVAGAVMALIADSIIKRIGNRALLAISVIAAAVSALILALAPVLWITLLGACFTGIAWTGIMIGAVGFLAEQTGEDDLQATNLFQQMIFASMFIGPLLGTLPLDLGVSSISVLLIGVGLRLAAAGLIQTGLHKLRPKRSLVRS